MRSPKMNNIIYYIFPYVFIGVGALLIAVGIKLLTLQ